MKIALRWMMGLLASGFMGMACAADGQPVAGKVSFDIDSQPMLSALVEFSKQSGIQVAFPAADAEGISAQAVVGELTPTAALERMLEGSGLRYEFANEGRIVTIRPVRTSQSGSNSIDGAVRVAQAEAPAGTQESAAAVTETDSEEKLEEIVVTAQKRVERLTDVPISISVLNGRDLDKFTGEGVSEALTLVPGIKMTQDGRVGGAQLSVRGVAASGPFINGSSPVAYYIDSVPFGFVKSAVVPDSNPYDLQRIEVLRGPQGTLYGANALNGVVRILTHEPDFNELEFKARTSLSTTDKGGESYRGDLAVNVPLVPGKLAARGVFGYNRLGGWIDNPVDGDTNEGEVRNVRLKLAAQPTEELSLGLSAWRSRADYDAPALATKEEEYPTSLPQPIRADYDVLGLKIDYQFPGFSVSSMTSHIDYENPAGEDLSLFGQGVFSTRLDSKVFSQEIILNSMHSGAWRWSLGGFYRDAEDRLIQDFLLVSPPIQPAPLDFGDASESFAFFGELTSVFLDGKLELTGGLRYFEDDVTQFENASHLVPPQPLYRRGDTFDAVSPRIILTWHRDDRSTLYASYSEGFRSGYNQSAIVAVSKPTFAPAEEDTLRNYEVGGKGSLFDGRLSYDAALYYIDWQDVQQVITIAPPVNLAVGLNGKSASGIGFDFALTARPIEGLQLGASISWNDLTLDGPVLDAPIEDGGVVLFDKGDRLSYSAKYTFGGSAEYAFPLGGSGLDGRISASANYSSKQVARAFVARMVFPNEGDGILMTRAALSIGSSDRWEASLFIDNATNEDGAAVTFSGFGIDFLDSRLRPRTVGAQFEFRF